MHLRLFCVLLVAAALSLSAQDHPGDPNAKAATAATPPPADAKKGPGRGKGGGGRGGDPAAMLAEMQRILATPAELEKGKKLFQAHCISCHGPNGEGSRGPTLAQPNLPRSGKDVDLLRIVQNGIAGTEMPRVLLQQGDAPYIAAFVRTLGQLPPEKVAGDPVKGAELFKTKGACFSCHTLDGQGVTFGPDLSDVGRRRSVAFLRRSLTDPGADIPQRFDPYRTDISLPNNFMYVRAKTKAGKEVAGIRINEDTYSIQLRDVTGEFHSYYKKELAELHKDAGVSPMPMYGALFTPSELDDVVAYLASLRGK
jgi:putative heme-binding domain-containing protein